MVGMKAISAYANLRAKLSESVALSRMAYPTRMGGVDQKGNPNRQAAEQEAAARRATDRQILEDGDHLVAVWNERQAKRMPMLFSPTIGAAITAGYWFLQARCPACRTTGDVDLRMLDWHRGAAVTALIPALSCRSCRPNAPFAELVCLSKSSVAEEYYAERSRNRWISE